MYTSFPPQTRVERHPTLVEMNLQGPPPGYMTRADIPSYHTTTARPVVLAATRPEAPIPPQAANKGKINAYLSDVFELPRLKDHMNQYNLVVENLGRQKTMNEKECKKDMGYHKARYDHIYESARASPTLGPVKGFNTAPWPSSKSVDHPLTNDNIYIDSKRKKTGDNSNFLAPWRVLKEEFPPRSGVKLSANRVKTNPRSGGKKSGGGRKFTKPTLEQIEIARSLVAPYLEHKTTNSTYGSTVNSTVNSPELGLKPMNRLNPIDVSPRRYKAPRNDDWKTDAWRRANKEYRAYREATQLSSIPLNRRVSNFIFGGNVVIA